MKTSIRALYFQALENRGKVFDLAGRFPEAIQDYSRILAARLDVRSKIRAHVGIGQVNMKSGNFQDALNQADRAYGLACKKALRLECIQCLILKSQVLVRTGQFNIAMQHVRQARRFLVQMLKRRDSEDLQLLDIEDARVMTLMSLVLCMQCRYKKAIPLLKIATAKFRKHHNIWNVAVVQMNLGNAYNESGEFDKALVCYDVSLRIKKKIGDQYGIANALHNMSRVLSMRGQHNLALDRTQQALQISEAVHDLSGMSSGYLAVGIHYRNLGRFEQALDAYHESLRISRSLHEPYIEIANLVNIAKVYLGQGLYNKSREMIDKAEEQARTLKNPYLLVSTLNVKAHHYFEKAEPVMIQAALDEAIKLSRKYNLNNEELLALTRQVRAILRWPDAARYTFTNASSLLRRAHSLARAEKSMEARATVLPAQIAYCLAKHDYKTANQHAKELIRIARQTKNNGLLPRAYYQLAQVMQAAGKNPRKIMQKAETLAKRVGVRL